jgi:hypothetical protein
MALHFLLEVGFNALCVCRSGYKVGQTSISFTCFASSLVPREVRERLVPPKCSSLGRESDCHIIPWQLKPWTQSENRLRCGVIEIMLRLCWVWASNSHTVFHGILGFLDKFPGIPGMSLRSLGCSVNLPNFLVEWLLLLFHIHDVPGSVTVPDAGCHNFFVMFLSLFLFIFYYF